MRVIGRGRLDRHEFDSGVSKSVHDFAVAQSAEAGACFPREAVESRFADSTLSADHDVSGAHARRSESTLVRIRRQNREAVAVHFGLDLHHHDRDLPTIRGCLHPQYNRDVERWVGTSSGRCDFNKVRGRKRPPLNGLLPLILNQPTINAPTSRQPMFGARAKSVKTPVIARPGGQPCRPCARRAQPVHSAGSGNARHRPDAGDCEAIQLAHRRDRADYPRRVTSIVDIAIFIAARRDAYERLLNRELARLEGWRPTWRACASSTATGSSARRCGISLGEPRPKPMMASSVAGKSHQRV